MKGIVRDRDATCHTEGERRQEASSSETQALAKCSQADPGIDTGWRCGAPRVWQLPGRSRPPLGRNTGDRIRQGLAKSSLDLNRTSEPQEEMSQGAQQSSPEPVSPAVIPRLLPEPMPGWGTGDGTAGSGPAWTSSTTCPRASSHYAGGGNQTEVEASVSPDSLLQP